jgi:hypothetical protein
MTGAAFEPTPKTLAEIRARHPMPWRQATIGNQCFMLDQRNEEVPMFTMLAFMGMVTAAMAAQPAAAPAQPA